jgi:hypothetical protein
MGGSGSGSNYHWWRSGKKTTVEECKDLDANHWMREGILKAGVRRSGSWRWVYHSGEEHSISYEVDTLDRPSPFVRLWYTMTHAATKEQESLDYRVVLTTTRPRYGGLRWWFICPLIVGGRPCERRVGKLYLPPGARYFGCRHCHELTYTSAQTHDKRVDALRRNPELLFAMANDPEAHSLSNLALLLKAIPLRRD